MTTKQKLPLCPDGYRWCPNSKKCIPDTDGKGQGRRQGRGGGAGPMGRPYKEEVAMKLVDVMLSGKFDHYKKVAVAEIQVDRILEKLENRIDHVPEQDMKDLKNNISDELGTSSLKECIKETMQLLLTEAPYHDFFRSMLKKYGVKSPAQLSQDQKKKFFKEVSSTWKKQKKT